MWSRAAGEDIRHIDKDVNFAIFPIKPAIERVYLFRVGNITSKGGGLTASIVDLLGSRLGPSFVNVGGDDLCTIAAEAQGKGMADTTIGPCAGDQRHFAAKVKKVVR